MKKDNLYSTPQNKKNDKPLRQLKIICDSSFYTQFKENSVQN